MDREQSVFVVDDDEFFRKAMQRVFRSAGFRVATFASADEFLSAYVPCDEACLILDLRMPRIGGLELLGRLRVRGIDVPVIIYTGNADVPVTVEAMQAGAFAVVEKPFSSELLIERVRAAIAHSRAQIARRTSVMQARARLGDLTARELQIAKCLADGLSAPEIGARLSISPRTVEAHRANLFRKLDINSSVLLAKLIVLAEPGHE